VKHICSFALLFDKILASTISTQIQITKEGGSVSIPTTTKTQKNTLVMGVEPVRQRWTAIYPIPNGNCLGSSKLIILVKEMDGWSSCLNTKEYAFGDGIHTVLHRQ